LTRLAGNAPPATSARYSVAGAPDARDGAVARALEIHPVAANVEREAVRAILLVVPLETIGYFTASARNGIARPE